MMTHDDPHAYLQTLPRFDQVGNLALQPGLERIQRLLARMGHPHDAFASVHVAGTNGKGSTASLLAAIATAASRRVGLHTSPHLWHLGERMRIDGVPAPDAWIAHAVTRYRDAMEEVSPSFFEATVALSFLYFAEHEVDLAVVEVGLGGRLDATNVLHPALSIVTNVGLEHTDLLGETLPQIAREKAGILKAGVPALTGATQPEVLAVLHEVADRLGAPLHRVQEETAVRPLRAGLDTLTMHVRTPLRTYDDLVVGLAGAHQQANAVLALRAAELLLDDVHHEPAAVYEGMRDVRQLSGVRGRLEVLQTRPFIVADVAHNPDGIDAALRFMATAPETERGRLYVLLGLMRDKDVRTIARLLAKHNAMAFATSLDAERALSADDLASLLKRESLVVETVNSVAAGVSRFRQRATARDALLITGSHQVVAGVRQPL